MEKLISKYLKIVICILMICCMVMPSFAYLTSGNDGSSFVTKAEFDSALADFNARLTTFEAGINSKIDSQVTSYLERNGIWKSQEQTLKLNFDYFLYAGSLGSTYASPSVKCELDGVTRTLNFNSYEAVNNASSLSIGEENTQVNRRLVVVENLSKSGLVVINYQYAPLATAFRSWYKTNRNNRNYCNISVNNTRGFGANSELGFESEDSDGNVTDISKVPFLTVIVSAGATTTKTLQWAAGASTAMGFVHSGDKLYYRCKFGYYGLDSSNASKAKSPSITFGDSKFAGEVLVIDSVKIY